MRTINRTRTVERMFHGMPKLASLDRLTIGRDCLSRPSAWLVLASLWTFIGTPNLTAQARRDDTAPPPDAGTATFAEDTNAPGTSATNTRAVVTEEDTQTVSGAPIVVIGKDAELKAGQSAEAVVVIGASAKIHGKVHDAVVVIGGDLDVDGEIGDAAVAVLGNVTAHKGAKIHGDVVAVGGKVDVEPGAKVSRTQQNIEFPEMK